MEDGESRVKILNRRDRSCVLNPLTPIPATILVLIFEAAEKNQTSPVLHIVSSQKHNPKTRLMTR